MNTQKKDQIKTILVTGSSGFVGSHLAPFLEDNGYKVIYASRTPPADKPHIAVDKLDDETDWAQALKEANVDAVIHCAGRAHILKESSENPLKEARLINVKATRKLAADCKAAGIKKFIFLSSIAVNGKSSPENTSFTENDDPNPYDAYGRSKMEAEEVVRNAFEDSQTSYYILRPPLVYGPGVKANFLKLIGLVQCGAPLPFKGIKNKRAFIGINNLNDFILQCIKTKSVQNETFIVSDDMEISTPHLTIKIAHLIGQRTRIFYFPPLTLEKILLMLGRRNLVHSMMKSLSVDISKAKTVMGWTPPYSMDEQLAQTIKAHQETQKKC